MKPRLLDLFCGAGGCSVGYARAGFEVVGVDVKPQPRYPFEFHQADAMTYPLAGFDAIHASPPCQFYTAANRANRSKGINPHADLVAETRDRLRVSGLPYVIENVEGAPLVNPLRLCGTEFDLTAYDVDGTPLELRRHRLFESKQNAVRRRRLPAQARNGPTGGRSLRRGRRNAVPRQAHPPRRIHAGNVRSRGAHGHRLDVTARTQPGHPARIHRAHRHPVARPDEGRRMTHVPLTLRHEPSRTTTGQPLDTWAIWCAYLPGIVGEVAKTWRQGLRGPELMPLVGIDPDGGEWGWEPIGRAA